MNTKEYVESLFKDYEESGSLKDFMEELQSNLDARIASLVRKGLPENEAFEKASAELGDVSLLADELSLKKRREVFEDAYLDTRKYMKGGRVAAYVIFGAVALFGLIISVIAYFAIAWGTGWLDTRDWGNVHIGPFGFFRGPRGGGFGLEWLSAFGAFMPFLVTSIGGFTYLGLTQETKSLLPMSKKRAAWYTAAAVLISFGLMVMLLTYLAIDFSGAPFKIMATTAVLIPFVLPGGALLVFLALSEKSRLKRWASSVRDDDSRQKAEAWADPADTGRFALISRAIWILAWAAFALFGFLVGFRYSWLAFLFAAAIKRMVQAFMMKKKA